MLQQTQVQTVIPYYERFMARFPTVFDLAAANETDVLKHWEGLGYYARARHLLHAARQVVSQLGGRLPESAEALKALPGIGDYTAGAILSIAWQKPVAAVDGNVVRVFARLTGTPWRSGDPADRRAAAELVGRWLPHNRPGDFNEAIMDLGATLCLPREPLCPACPLRHDCVAHNEQRVNELPLKQQKRPVPVEQHTVVILRRQKRWHVVKRPAQGLLAGLYTFDWLAGTIGPETQAYFMSAGASWLQLTGHTHRFTHLAWQLDGCLVDLGSIAVRSADNWLRPVPDTGVMDAWVTDSELAALPFPGALEPFRRQALALADPVRTAHP